jgi:hypothetical protein
MTYGISSRDYLARAKRCLINNGLDSLFYAAFEVRCGIEARMQEYLEVQAHVSKKKRQGWQVAKLARNIENVFRLGEKEAVLRVRDRQTKEVLFEARYTPVKMSLRKKAEMLGNVLHAAKMCHAPDSPYWKKFRADLEAAVFELEYANSGRLLGPLLLHPNKKRVDMKLELPTPEEQEAVKCLAVGAETIMEVSYE